MRCKTSCFNPTLAKHNLKRFWPLPVAIFLILLVVMVFNYYTSMLYVNTGAMESAAAIISSGTYQTGEIVAEEEINQAVRSARNAVYSFSSFVIVFEIFTALLSALLVMHHIHGRKQIQFYHGLPLTRRCIYVTNVVTGYLMALLPLILVELIILIMALCMGAEGFPALQLMGLSTASFTILYAVAILACVMAGQSFGAVLLFGGMNCVAVAISVGGAGIMRYILPGFNANCLFEQLTYWLTPVMYLVRNSSPLYTEIGVGMPYGFRVLPFAVYAVAGILLLILSGFFYKLRRGETAGEMISFSFIRGLCKVLVALMAGLGGTVVVVLSLNPHNDIGFPVIALMVLVLLILGWIIADMVIRKTFRVFQKNAVAQCLTLTVIMLLVLVGARLDVTGYVNRLPNLDKVSVATLQAYGLPVDVEPTDALRFHETVLENRDELSNNTTYRSLDRISIQYYDEDGAFLMERQYYVLGGLESDILQEFLTLMSTPEYNYRSWFTWQDHEITLDTISEVNLYSANRYYEKEGLGEEIVPYFHRNGSAMVNDWQKLTPEEGYQLYEAICRDIQEGNMVTRYQDYFVHGLPEYGHLELHCYNEAYDETYVSYEDYRKNAEMSFHDIAIYGTMTHTLKALEEMGITLNPEALK